MRFGTATSSRFDYRMVLNATGSGVERPLGAGARLTYQPRERQAPGPGTSAPPHSAGGSFHRPRAGGVGSSLTAARHGHERGESGEVLSDGSPRTMRSSGASLIDL